MRYENGKAKDLKIAYVGGGSRGWAWGLMSDLASYEDISGDVYLYDIDYKAAQDNEIIGNKYNAHPEAKTTWNYHACKTAEEALTDADFVVISILPGTFKEMASDVHTPEKYGIYQTVGDTTGPGGIVRAMRCIPMFEEIGENIKKYCPKAWVINYTNPMTLCIKTLYRVFPEIRAFGCCHEVFGTQKVLRTALEEICGITIENRNEIKVNPISVNHFTWLTSASYKNMDLFPVYEEFVNRYYETGYTKNLDDNWMNNCFACSQRVKFDLFRRYGYIAAAGDRHLAEFSPGKWYLQNPEVARGWGFSLTPVSWRTENLAERLEKSRKLVSGEMDVEMRTTGEEGVLQMRAILGLGGALVTNVNIPNKGQVPNLPLGAVVETNAVFQDNSVTPVFAGEIPTELYSLISRVCGLQELVSDAIAKRDVDMVFNAFASDPLTTCTYEEARKLFKEMVLNTKEYLSMYDLSCLDNY